MTPGELFAIAERDEAAELHDDGFLTRSELDRRALLAEVERLREEVTFHNTVRLDVEKVLDKAHGTEEEDGAGAGLAADVDLLRVQRDDARGIAAALEQELARIRDLHAPNEAGNCSNRCYSSGIAPVAFPCLTRRIADGTEADQ